MGKVFAAICHVYIRSQVPVRSRDSVLSDPVPPEGLNEVSAAAHLQFLYWVVALRAVQVTQQFDILRSRIGNCVDLAPQKILDYL
jgi:hypothetical protein